MKTTAHNSPHSTQAFTEILDIREGVVLMKGGNACLLIELQAVNFALLSGEEQDAKVFQYANLLNSLSFPIQIVMRSKRVDITPYIQSLADVAAKAVSPKLAQNINQYKGFVQQLITSSSILDKQFFFCISYSLLEEGIGGVTNIVHSERGDDFFLKAHAGLYTKAESLLSQVDRMNLRAKIVEGDELIRLFHDIYNEK